MIQPSFSPGADECGDDGKDGGGYNQASAGEAEEAASRTLNMEGEQDKDMREDSPSHLSSPDVSIRSMSETLWASEGERESGEGQRDYREEMEDDDEERRGRCPSRIGSYAQPSRASSTAGIRFDESTQTGQDQHGSDSRRRYGDEESPRTTSEKSLHGCHVVLPGSASPTPPYVVHQYLLPLPLRNVAKRLTVNRDHKGIAQAAGLPNLFVEYSGPNEHARLKMIGSKSSIALAISLVARFVYDEQMMRSWNGVERRRLEDSGWTKFREQQLEVVTGYSLKEWAKEPFIPMDESRSNGHERGRANWQSSISIRRNSMSQRPASPPRRPSDRLPPPREVAYPSSCPLDGLTESRKPPSPPPSLPRHKMHPPHTSLPRPLHRDPPPPSFARVVSAPRKPQPPSRQKASLFERVSNPPPRRTSTSNTNPHVDHRTPPFSTASPSLPHTSTRNDKRERRSSRRVNVDDFDRSQKPKAKPAASPVKKPPAKLATASSARRPVADEVDCARASGVGSFDIDNSKYNFEFDIPPSSVIYFLPNTLEAGWITLVEQMSGVVCSFSAGDGRCLLKVEAGNPQEISKALPGIENIIHKTEAAWKAPIFTPPATLPRLRTTSSNSSAPRNEDRARAPPTPSSIDGRRRLSSASTAFSSPPDIALGLLDVSPVGTHTPTLSGRSINEAQKEDDQRPTWSPSLSSSAGASLPHSAPQYDATSPTAELLGEERIEDLRKKAKESARNAKRTRDGQAEGEISMEEGAAAKKQKLDAPARAQQEQALPHCPVPPSLAAAYNPAFFHLQLTPNNLPTPALGAFSLALPHPTASPAYAYPTPRPAPRVHVPPAPRAISNSFYHSRPSPAAPPSNAPRGPRSSTPVVGAASRGRWLPAQGGSTTSRLWPMQGSQQR